MSIFGSIMSKLGFGDKAAAPAAAVEAPVEVAAPEATAEQMDAALAAGNEVAAISEVDVYAQLEALAAESTAKSNWKVSIVDLMMLLGLDSSFAARKELAIELECPEEKMHDSAQMNMWLHKTVLTKLAENGGNVPADLIA